MFARDRACDASVREVLPELFAGVPARAVTLSRRGLLGGALSGATLAMLPGQALARMAGADRALAGAGVEGEWPEVTRLLASFVDDHRLPGAIAAFSWPEGGLRTIARGRRSLDDPHAPDADTLYRMYSMTKPLTGMIAMGLVDAGKLKLDQPLSDFFPEFAQMRVAIDPEKGLDSVPAKTGITIRQLLTHTSGLCYSGVHQDACSREAMRLGVVAGRVARQPIPGLTDTPVAPKAEWLKRLASIPLVAEPGTRWYYSMGLDVMGLVIEQITGKTLDVVMAEQFFGPLGMASSFFAVPAADARRLTSNYMVKDGKLEPLDPAKTSVYLEAPIIAFGGSGLVTSPADYDRFLRMVAGGGQLNGVRVLSQAAVAMGTSNLLPEGASVKGTTVDGWGFGAGGNVGISPGHLGTYGWAGAAGTVGFVNTRLGLAAGLYVQYMPLPAYRLPHDFPDAVRADLLARPPEG